MCKSLIPKYISDPNGIRTRVTAVKGRCPRPLDDRVFGKRAREFAELAPSLQADSRPQRLNRRSFRGAPAYFFGGVCASRSAAALVFTVSSDPAADLSHSANTEPSSSTHLANSA